MTNDTHMEGSHAAWVASLKPGDEIEVLEPYTNEWKRAVVTGRQFNVVAIVVGGAGGEIPWCAERLRPLDAQGPHGLLRGSSWSTGVRIAQRQSEALIDATFALAPDTPTLTVTYDLTGAVVDLAVDGQRYVALTAPTTIGIDLGCELDPEPPDDPRSAGLLTLHCAQNERTGR